MSKLQFGLYDFDGYGYMPAPKPSLNGGLYTGEEFAKGAEYANVPIKPDTTEYINKVLGEYKEYNNTPIDATYMYPPTRRGNSKVDWDGLVKYEGTKMNWGPHNIYCAEKECVSERKNSTCMCDELCPSKDGKNPLCNSRNCTKRGKHNVVKQGFSKYYYVR